MMIQDISVKKKEYLKAEINYFQTKSEIKNIRDLNRDIKDSKQGYQPRPNIVKDKKGDLVTDSHSILVRWRNYFSQLLNVHGVNEVSQKKIYTTEPLVPEPSVFEFELAIEKLKGHKSPGVVQIAAELIKAGDGTISSEINRLSNSIYNQEELSEDWQELIIVPIYKKAVVTIEAYHFFQLRPEFYPTSCCHF